MHADIDEVLDSKSRVVFALDQPTFESGKFEIVNTFSVLVPLMTEDGRRFENVERTFANRGRVWWMLLPDQVRESPTTGSIWSSELEHSVKFEPSVADKDRYQVRRTTAEAGTKDWVDLLDVPFEVADLGLVLSADGLALDRPPLRTVLLRGADGVVGPFHATWNPASGRAVMTALNLGNPQAFLAPRTALRPGEHIEEFKYRANRWFRQERERDIVIRLVAKQHVDLLQKSGRPIDAASDAQVINWALAQANYKGAERSAFKDALARIPAVTAGGDPTGRMARFRGLCERAERVRGLGVEVAETLGKQPAFAGLVRDHADGLAKARVDELVRQRTADIDRLAHETTGKVEKLKKDLVALDKSYDERKAAQENALAEERGEWLRKLTVREEAIVAREAGIDARQKEMAKRLEDVVHRYETKGAEIGAEILTQVPILRRIGLGGGAESQLESAGRLQMPTWFSRPRAVGQLSEQAFLAQFADVAERHGYVFSEEDLIAFHVAVKIGFWTVLAGPSGTGKTSLPRLYAEALGVADEFDSIAVRPDWLDDRDVVGAFNALAGRFEPAATGLVDRLIAAAEDLSIRRGGIYIVCLDEMNLARVEHYFAQFLSVLEEPAARRRLHLFSRGVERPGEPYAPWRELPIGENVRFVGTVNIDETTHFFSPKVLDRAPVLTFGAPAIDRAPSAHSKAATIDVTPVRFDEYTAWIRGPEVAAAGVGTLLVAVDRTLRPIRSGLGFRLRDRVLSYVASAAGLLSEDRAFDLALSQSVLPRMRTNEPGFGEAVEALLGHLPEKRFPTTARLLGLMRDSRGAHDFFHLLGS